MINDDSQILIARLLTHQTLRRDDKLVKRVLSDELFRAEVDKRLLESGLKLLDNVYADHVTLALHRAVEPKIFGAKDIWQNNNFGLTRDGVALLVVLWAQIILPKRERQETHQNADDDQNDLFDKDKPMPRAEDTSIGISYTALLSDFGDKLGKKTRMDMNLGALSRMGFIERRGDVILEGPLLDLLMDTDVLKERIINGALADVFKRAPVAVVVPKPGANDAANDATTDAGADAMSDAGGDAPADATGDDSADAAGDAAIDASKEAPVDIAANAAIDGVTDAAIESDIEPDPRAGDDADTPT